MAHTLLCFFLLVATPFSLCKSVEKREALSLQGGLGDLSTLFNGEERENRLLTNQLSSTPWWCRIDPDQPECQSRAEEGRQADDILGLLGGSGAAMEARDVHQDTFVETLRTAAQEFEAKRELAKAERAEAPARRVVTCVYCDNRCVAKAASSGYASAKDYFDVTIAEMNRIVQSGLDENMSFELTFVLLPYTITEMSWFFDYSATTSEELLTAINNKFWKDSGLFDMAAGNGCDVDFLAGAPEDPAWNYMGSIEGIANMFQLCLSSYSTVMMNPNPVSLAKLMTHEFGHMLGIYHDGALNVAFTGMAEYFAPGQMMGECETEFEVLTGACNVGSVGCPSGKCIMAATVDGTEWSDCSKAYYSMYNCLVDVMPTYYSDTCTQDR